MSDKTPRFGLSFYGGAVPGSLTDDGNAFTLRDPVTTDRILNALEGHEHTGTGAGAQVPDPAGLPTATLLTGGTIEAGQTLYYVVTFVDRFGLESGAGDEISVETGEVILPPSSPDAETGPGGSLSPGLYYYALTALDGVDETTLSAPEMATVIEGEGSVTLNLPDVPDGADSLRVWRQGPGEGTFSRLDVATDVTFVDDGSIPPDPCPWDPAHQPPSENTTRADGAVQVELAPEDAAVLNDRSRRIASWRLYRTTVSGTYAASSLVTEMTSHVDEDPDSDLLAVYVDDGADLQAGSPPPVSQTLREPTSIAVPVAPELPTDGVYPANYPLLVGDQLYVFADGVEWVLVGGSASSALVEQVIALEEQAQQNDARITALEQGTGAGVSVSGIWQLFPEAGGIPGGEQCTCDTGSFSTATVLNFSKQAQGGTDWSGAIIDAVKIYGQQQTNATNYVRYDVSGTPTDEGTYVAVPVTVTEAGGVVGTALWATGIFVFTAAP